MNKERSFRQKNTAEKKQPKKTKQTSNIEVY